MDQDVTTLGDHVAILRRRWRILVACAVLGVLAGLGLSSLQAPVYQSRATLLLEPERVSSSAVVMDAGEVATQARVVASAPVAARVTESLGLDEEPAELLRTVTAEVLEQTRTVEITARRPTAAEAADVANAFAEEYIEFRTGAAVTSAGTARDQLATQLANVRADLSEVRDQLAEVGLSEQRQRALEAQEQSLLTVEAEIRTEITLSREEAPSGTVGGEVLRAAEPPQSPAQPRPLRAAALGGLLGFLAGVLLAYVRDRVDDGIRDEQRLRSAVEGQPVLGRIPREDSAGDRLVTVLAPHSSESEGYRTLTTNLRFLSSGASPRDGGELLVISSAVPGEGKTTVAANVAVTAARVGLQVILVDADLRSPGVSSRFGIETPLGLSHVLADQAEIEKVAFDGAEIDLPGLQVIGAGVVPPNPGELLAGPRAIAVWRELRGQADLVIVDTAPVLRVADTLEIVGEADLTVLVARYRTSRVHRVQAATERIRQVGGAVAGVAWCAVPQREAPYGYGYAAPEA